MAFDQDPCAEFNAESGDPTRRLDVRVDLRVEDTLRAAVQIFSMRARVLIGAYVLAALGSIVFLATRGATPAATAWLAVAAAGALLLPVVVIVLVYRQAKAGFEQSAEGTHIIQYRFSPAGVLIETLERSGWFEWNAFQGFAELPSCFLLFTGRDDYFVVPKRCLPGSETLTALRSVLHRHLKTERPR